MRLIYLLFLLIAFQALNAQFKPHIHPEQSTRRKLNELDIQPFQPIPGRIAQTNAANPVNAPLPDNFTPINLSVSLSNAALTIYRDQKTGLPIYIEGALIEKNKPTTLNNQAPAPAFSFLQALQQTLQIKQPLQEFAIADTQVDELGYTHYKMRQQFQGIEVYGAEVSLHAKDGVVELFNGRYFPTPNLATTRPSLSESDAIALAWKQIAQTEKIKPFGALDEQLAGKQLAKSQLMVYHVDDDPVQEKLAWYMELSPQVLSRWAYIIDAQNGAVLKKYSLVCTLAPHLNLEGYETAEHVHSHFSPTATKQGMPLADGPATAVARDLLGINRTINTYSVKGTYYLIDGSRPMFKLVSSTLPDDPTGALWTLDGGNTSPTKDNFEANHVVSPNNVWNNPTAVSSHYNAGVAYEYFRKTFTRNSINGKGGTIISLVNISDDDGTPLDNAFWNGQAMFYGNGKKAFKPLARALDVASHELSHGVIQNTANLEYNAESGALNESYADVFGMLNDRGNWKIGEDVVNTAYFPTGALRDLSNPNNGGTKLGDNGWQPATVSQQYLGTEDNGGVHINSGIANRAFYLIATQGGLDKAEQVYYRALTNYLTKYSKFVDARLAIAKAAKDIGGAALETIANNAFETVGIRTGQPTTTKPDQPLNTGSQYVLTTTETNSALYVYTPTGDLVANPLITEGILSKPSISDDGTLVVYVTKEKKIRAISIDWVKGQVQKSFLSEQTIWRNVALSKDGNRIAALTDALNPQIYVVDFTKATSNSKTFNLYNPTYTSGVNSGQVQYSDAMEWDLTGSSIVYDALNEIKVTGGSPYQYWDIGLIKVYNTKTKTFDTGNIDKLFTGLDEGENIGNPTFAKNSPSIIAFDYVYDANNDGIINDGDDFLVYASNFETNKTNVLYTNTTVGYPNFSTKDDYIYFNAESNTNASVVALLKLATNKIEPATGSVPSIFKSNTIWGVNFATGKRVLTGVHEVQTPDGTLLKVYPNPFSAEFQIELALSEPQTLWIEVFDLVGKRVWSELVKGATGLIKKGIAINEAPSGTYLIRVTAGKNSTTQKIVKY